MTSYTSISVCCWDELHTKITEHKLNKFGWVFRGQVGDWPLKTTLQRACDDLDTCLEKAPIVETHMIRDFRRRYRGDDYEELRNDMLYCLSLMQHHGAPTRLLDFTYSVYVAIFFALESKPYQIPNCESNAVLWCVNLDWTGTQAAMLDKSQSLKKDRPDSERGHEVFEHIYMPKNKCFSQFIHHENPLRLSQRLILQQGVFVCAGDVTICFEDNIKKMANWNKKTNLIKFLLCFNNDERKKTLENLYRMNINRSVLFPGLDGFSQSFKLRIPTYLKIEDARKINE